MAIAGMLVRQPVPRGPDVLDQRQRRRHTVHPQVVRGGAGPDEPAVGVEAHPHHGLVGVGQLVAGQASGGQHERRGLQVLQHRLLFPLAEHRAGTRSAGRRRSGRRTTGPAQGPAGSCVVRVPAAAGLLAADGGVEQPARDGGRVAWQQTQLVRAVLVGQEARRGKRVDVPDERRAGRELEPGAEPHTPARVVVPHPQPVQPLADHGGRRPVPHGAVGHGHGDGDGHPRPQRLALDGQSAPPVRRGVGQRGTERGEHLARRRVRVAFRRWFGWQRRKPDRDVLVPRRLADLPDRFLGQVPGDRVGLGHLGPVGTQGAQGEHGLELANRELPDGPAVGQGDLRTVDRHLRRDVPGPLRPVLDAERGAPTDPDALAHELSPGLCTSCCTVSLSVSQRM